MSKYNGIITLLDIINLYVTQYIENSFQRVKCRHKKYTRQTNYRHYLKTKKKHKLVGVKFQILVLVISFLFPI